MGAYPWKRKWPPTPVFLPGEFHGQRSLAGYSPWGHRVQHNWETEQALTCGCRHMQYSHLTWPIDPHIVMKYFSFSSNNPTLDVYFAWSKYSYISFLITGYCSYVTHFPIFYHNICRCLCNKSWCLMLRHVQLFATPRTAYIYLDLSFCFLCRTSKILFHGFLYAVVSDFKKPFIIHVTVLLSVMCTLSLVALFSSFIFQQFKYDIMKHDFFFIHPTCGFSAFSIL